MKFKCRRTGETANTYNEYLVTQHWRDLRVDVYHKAEGRCKCCGWHLTNNFIAHHVSTGAYSRVGRERFNAPYPKFLRVCLRLFGVKREFYDDDVIAVCRRCHDGESKQHKKLHENINVPYWARREG